VGKLRGTKKLKLYYKTGADPGRTDLKRKKAIGEKKTAEDSAPSILQNFKSMIRRELNKRRIRARE